MVATGRRGGWFLWHGDVCGMLTPEGLALQVCVNLKNKEADTPYSHEAPQSVYVPCRWGLRW